MVREGILDGCAPSMMGLSLAEAEEASKIMAIHPGITHDDGSRTLLCFVDPVNVARLYAWAILQAEDTHG